jgi:uncharacterized protein (TIGR02611 family)
MLRLAKRLVILIVGMTVLLIGIIMIVAPGPAILVIPAGLAILATEYAWARRWLRIIRESAEKGAGKLKLQSLFSRNVNKSSEQSAVGGPQ